MEHFLRNELRKLEKIFHKSNPTNRESIQQNGLLPTVGESYQSRYGDGSDKKLIPAIFMYHTDPNQYDTTWDDDIWIIDFTGWGHQLYKDKAVRHQEGIISLVLIPSSRVKLFYSGTGKDLLGRYK